MLFTIFCFIYERGKSIPLCYEILHQLSNPAVLPGQYSIHTIIDPWLELINCLADLRSQLNEFTYIYPLTAGAILQWGPPKEHHGDNGQGCQCRPCQHRGKPAQAREGGSCKNMNRGDIHRFETLHWCYHQKPRAFNKTKLSLVEFLLYLWCGTRRARFDETPVLG